MAMTQMIKSKKKKVVDGIEELEPQEIPEVVDFIIADQEMNEFVEEIRLRHPGILEMLEQLAETRNAMLEAADKAVRSRRQPCGPFEIHTTFYEYNAVALYDAVGEAKFLEMGGTIATKQVFEVDGKRFDAAVAGRRITPEVENAVKTRRVNFKRIGKAWVT